MKVLFLLFLAFHLNFTSTAFGKEKVYSCKERLKSLKTLHQRATADANFSQINGWLSDFKKIVTKNYKGPYIFKKSITCEEKIVELREFLQGLSPDKVASGLANLKAEMEKTVRAPGKRSNSRVSRE